MTQADRIEAAAIQALAQAHATPLALGQPDLRVQTARDIVAGAAAVRAAYEATLPAEPQAVDGLDRRTLLHVARLMREEAESDGVPADIDDDDAIEERRGCLEGWATRLARMAG